MDLLVHLKDFWFNLINHLPYSLSCFILRMGLLLGLSTVLLSWAWESLPRPTVFSQTCVAFLTVVVALYIPVDKFRLAGEFFLAFTVTLAFLCMIFLPSWLPFWLTPKLGNQAKLRKIVVCIVWGLFLVQLITAYISNG